MNALAWTFIALGIAIAVTLIVLTVFVCIRVTVLNHFEQNGINRASALRQTIKYETERRNANHTEHISSLLGDMSIFYINLAGSKDRNEHIMRQLAGVHNVTRVEACDGRNADTSDGEMGGLMYHNTLPLTGGEVGCTLSHIKALQLAEARGDGVVMVVEDDADFSLHPLWPCSVHELLVRNHDTHWDTIQLQSMPTFAAHLSLAFATSSPTSAPDPTIISVTRNFGAAAYLITPAARKRLLDLVIDEHGVVQLNSSLPCHRWSERGKADDLVFAAGTAMAPQLPWVIAADDKFKSDIAFRFLDMDVQQMRAMGLLHVLRQWLVIAKTPSVSVARNTRRVMAETLEAAIATLVHRGGYYSSIDHDDDFDRDATELHVTSNAIVAPFAHHAFLQYVSAQPVQSMEALVHEWNKWKTVVL